MAAITEARVVAKVDKDKQKKTFSSQPITPKTVDTSRDSKENWLVETSLDDIVSTTKGQKNGDMEVNSSSSIIVVAIPVIRMSLRLLMIPKVGVVGKKHRRKKILLAEMKMGKRKIE